MEGILKFRHNVMNITTISGFENIKGGINGRCKDVYFVRALGTNSAYEKEIGELDRALGGLTETGRGYYCRLNGLPKLQNIEDSSFYSDCYMQWTKGGRQRADTRVTAGNDLLAGMLGNACAAVERLCMQGKQQMTESMCKNMTVKMLFWYDSVFRKEEFLWDERKVLKIVAANIEKRQEYLFFYLLTLMGCDILLLQSRKDIGEEEERLGLSAKFVLGDYSDTAIPEYTGKSSQADMPGETGRGREVQASLPDGQGGNIRVKIPPRREEETKPGKTMPPRAAGEEPKGKVTVPPRAAEGEIKAKATVPPRIAGGETKAKVTIPPRTAGGETKAKVTVPPRAAEGETKAKVTIPPRRAGERNDSKASALPGVPKAEIPSVSVLPSGAGSVPRPGIQAGNAEKSFEELARLASSVVMIAIHNEKGEVIGTGSGIMVGRDGYILTNDHVASGGKYYSVRIEDDEKAYTTDEVIKYNYVLDLAVIRIDRKLIPLPIYHGQKKLVRGQKVVAIGSPLGLFNSVSDGIISGFRKIDNVDMIQFTAPTSHGSSGGAVLNMQGEVIGISTAGFDSGQNINLAMGYECINTFIRGFT